MQKKRVLINESIVSIEKMSRRFSRKGKELLVIVGLFLILGSLLILHQDSFIQVIGGGNGGTDLSPSHGDDDGLFQREAEGLFTCSCNKENIDISQFDSDNTPFYDKTTCSPRAYLRGKGQKIIGFSYYGDSRSAHHQKKKYFEGIQNNLKLLQKFYPGWIIRLYYDLAQDDPILPKLCGLSCQTNFDLCDIQRLPGTPMSNATFVFPMNWRFFPTRDPQVDVYLSRDLDSEFNEREIAAVSEWLESEDSFHMMRDHPMHDIGMLGSAWGVKLLKDKVRLKWRKAWKDGFQDGDGLMWKARNLTGPDQGFLRKYIWPWAKFDAMQHDSYFCKKYSGTRAFPVKRKNETNNFVAAVVAEKQYIWKKCPEKCRPRDHLEWEYC